MVEMSRKNVPALNFAHGVVLTIKFTVAPKMGNGEWGTASSSVLR